MRERYTDIWRDDEATVAQKILISMMKLFSPLGGMSIIIAVTLFTAVFIIGPLLVADAMFDSTIALLLALAVSMISLGSLLTDKTHRVGGDW